MSSTALDHPLVRGYLHELGVALLAVPVAQARELREQITAHLEEALPPGAGDREVAAALSQLGSPADLAAEAQAAGGAPSRVPAAALGWTWLTRVRRRTWIAAVLAVLLAAAGAKAADRYLSAGPLQFNNGADWWFSQDARREAIVTAGTTTQSTTPIRSGQLQGYVISIFNPTDVTQTILGDASGPSIGWDNPGGPSEHIAVSRSSTHIPSGSAGQSLAGNIRFTLPVSVPPLQSRLVRVLWTSVLCLSKGETQGIDQLYLRVRVGWFTRTEIIPQQAWYLAGPSKGQPNWRHCI